MSIGRQEDFLVDLGFLGWKMKLIKKIDKLMISLRITTQKLLTKELSKLYTYSSHMNEETEMCACRPIHGAYVNLNICCIME